MLLEVGAHTMQEPSIVHSKCKSKTRNANQLEGHCVLHNPLQISEVPLPVPATHASKWSFSQYLLYITGIRWALEVIKIYSEKVSYQRSTQNMCVSAIGLLAVVHGHVKKQTHTVSYTWVEKILVWWYQKKLLHEAWSIAIM